jgi:hypothetical protein
LAGWSANIGTMTSGLRQQLAELRYLGLGWRRADPVGLATGREHRLQLRRPCYQHVITARGRRLDKRDKRVEVAHAAGRGEKRAHPTTLGRAPAPG